MQQQRQRRRRQQSPPRRRKSPQCQIPRQRTQAVSDNTTKKNVRKSYRQRQVWRPKRSDNINGSAGAVVGNKQDGSVAIVDPATAITSSVSVIAAEQRQHKPIRRQQLEFDRVNDQIKAKKSSSGQANVTATLNKGAEAATTTTTIKPKVESLGPPVTWHVTHDFVVTEPTANLFNVPNCLTDPSADSGRFVRSTLNVHPKLNKFSQINLTEGGQRLKTSPNAGGNSVASEVISFEVMRAAYGADLLKTEMQLEYFPMGGSITDYSVLLYDLHIGVSVTRAMKYNGVFDTTDAARLLKKKLQGVIDSSRLVVEPFHKQVLHIFCEADYVVDVLEEVYYGLDPALKSSTLVVATAAKNARWIFTNHYDIQ